MKKALLVIGALALIACIGWAQEEEILYKTTVTVKWDASTDVLLNGDTMWYEVWMLPKASGLYDPQDTATVLGAGGYYVGETSAVFNDDPVPENNPYLQLTHTYNQRVQWYVGVRNYVMDAAGNTGPFSEFIWSMVGGDTASGVPFAYSPVPSDSPTTATDLRDSGT